MAFLANARAKWPGRACQNFEKILKIHISEAALKYSNRTKRITSTIWGKHFLYKKLIKYPILEIISNVENYFPIRKELLTL